MIKTQYIFSLGFLILFTFFAVAKTTYQLIDSYPSIQMDLENSTWKDTVIVGADISFEKTINNTTQNSLANSVKDKITKTEMILYLTRDEKIIFDHLVMSGK